MDIRFNYARPRYWEEEDKWVIPSGGDKMEVKPLKDIKIGKNKDKGAMPWLQMFNCGYRVKTDIIDWESWNGCVYSDIDSKHYYNECKHFKADVLMNALHEYLLINYNFNYYCMQMSNSGTGYHILFYFDVEKNEESFKKCAQRVREIVEEAFINIGAKEIFEWPHVADKCSESAYQGMYLTDKPWLWGNSEQPGFGSFEDFDTYELSVSANKYVSDIKADGTKLFEFKSYTPVTEPVSYKDHHQRGVIYRTLMGIFNEKEKVDAEWEKICRLIPEANGHNRDFYINEPEKNRWFQKYCNIPLVNVNMLKEFGYSFNKIFEPAESESTYKPDVISLLSGEILP